MIKRILLFTMLIAFIFSAWIGIEAISFLTQSPEEAYQEQIFEVRAGRSFTHTAYRLQEEGLISNARYFVWYAKLRRDTGRLKAGEFRLSKSFSPKQIMDELIKGNVVKYPITIPEGYNMFDIAMALEARGLTTQKEFLAVAQDGALASQILEHNVPSFDGFLYPETYRFSKTEGARVIVMAMANQFKKAYEQVLREPNLLQLPFVEHVTLASMIEKETGAEEEREIISSVFHNRLKKRMRLQSDPTILYGIMIEDGTWKKNIQRSDITRSTKYNTYTIPALPPAPIANPGYEALRASLNPADTDFLYFVSRNDGTHVFSKTYAEHRKAVRDFQLNPKAREGRSWRDLNNRRTKSANE